MNRHSTKFTQPHLQISLLRLQLKIFPLHIYMLPSVTYNSSIPEIDDSPHVGTEPESCATVSLVLPDEDGVGYRQEPHQGAVLQKL